MTLKRTSWTTRLTVLIASIFGWSQTFAQTAPSPMEVAAYDGLFAAIGNADEAEVKRLINLSSDLNDRDDHGRTSLMVATYLGNEAIAEMLIKAGADVNALDSQRYDMLTIAAVANDIKLVELAIASGADPALVTSPYDGTALIAAAHLGHVEVVRALIAAGAPLDHVNNIKWTALIESIVLGDGGPSHQTVLRDLIDAGADINLADGQGRKPLVLARLYGYTEMEQLLLTAGAKP